jgi:two-component sensor histidine kinase/PAS domain-containing protein
LVWKTLWDRLGPYALAVVLTAVAAAAQAALSAKLRPPAALALFAPAIVGSAKAGVGPGIFAFSLSVLAAWLFWPSSAAETSILEFSVVGVCFALVVAILWPSKRASTWLSRENLPFRAVQDISTEGIVVYRAVQDGFGRVVDFEYRYANPAACAIMRGRPEDVVGARLLERLPEAREHPHLFSRYTEVFTSGETSEAEYELGERWFHSRVARLDDGVVVTVRDVSARRRADDVQKLLLQELNHRVKNLLATVIAMVVFTERGSTTPAEYRDKLSARLHALSRAHNLLSGSAWTEASVADVVRSTLEPHLDRSSARFQINGDAFEISSDTALALNMALHELATNAAKYGALSRPGGRIAIQWTACPDRPGFVRLVWTESGGPPASTPESSGFGTRMLDRAFAAANGEVNLLFPPEGVVCEMVFPSAEVSSSMTA